MRVVVFGAAGRVGRRVVEYALEAGHEVRAVVRTAPQVPFPASDRLHLDRGDATDPLVAAMCVRGAGAVVSAVGNGVPEAGVQLRTEATRRILAAMDVHGVPRFVLVSAAAVLPGPWAADETPGLAALIADHRGAWAAVEASGVDYTLACADRITAGGRRRDYRRAIEALPEGGREISPEDVADFVVDALDAPDYSRTRVGIAY
jgi:uncharacterized protein YbjT (DUF2867 family)